MNNECSQQGGSYFEQLGGDKEISELIDGFFYKVLMDKSLGKFYLNTNLTNLRFQQKRYISYILGSDQKYEGKDLYEAHEFLQVTDAEYDKFKYHMESMLKDKEKPQHIIDFILNKIEEQRKVIVIKQKLQ